MAGRYNNKRRAPKGRRSYKKKGRAVTRRVPRNVFSNSGGTSFTIARHFTVSANTTGTLDAAWAMGNINLSGWHSFKHDTAQTAHSSTDTNWPATLDNLKAVYNTMRVIKHEMTLAPVCFSGDQSAVPVEKVYQKFAIDNGTTAVHCQKLTGYGSAASSQLLMPSDQRMPVIKHASFPSKTSIGDVQKYPIPATASQTSLSLSGSTAGSVNSAHTFGFLKLYAEGLESKQALYQAIERITILVSDRKV